MANLGLVVLEVLEATVVGVERVGGILGPEVKMEKMVSCKLVMPSKYV